MTVTTKPIVTMFYSVEHHPGITDRDAMLRCLGGNTGNLLFRYALQERMIDCSNCQILPLPSTLDVFRSLDASTCRQVLSSALVIYPVANLLRPSKEFEANPAVQAETEFVTHLSQLFEGPFLVMGLGYQGRLRPEAVGTRDLHPLQVEMLDALLQHTPFSRLALALLALQQLHPHLRTLHTSVYAVRSDVLLSALGMWVCGAGLPAVVAWLAAAQVYVYCWADIAWCTARVRFARMG